MTARTSAEDLQHAGIGAVSRAAEHLGLRVAARPGHGADLLLALPGGAVVAIEVRAAAVPSRNQVVERRPRSPEGVTTVVVGDRIPGPVRQLLSEAGIGWLDRRGHLRLVAPGVFIDSDVPPAPRHLAEARPKRRPINGRSGLAAASALLVRPDDPPAVTQIARSAGLNPSSITRALSALADAHLAERIDRGRYRPLIPELFWELAEAWPREQMMMRMRERAPFSAAERDDSARRGWAAAGIPAAVAWGAPLAVTADFPVHLYAPGEQDLREAVIRNAGGTGEAVVLSVDPTGLVTATRFRRGALAWPLAHPLFCALDLTESARDREALEQWTPPEGFTRVW